MRAWASDVLSAVESPSPHWAPQLAELTRHVNAPVASWSCKMLGRMGENATAYQASLAAALQQHPLVSVRQSAALALKSVPNLNTETLIAIKSAASDPDPRLSRLRRKSSLHKAWLKPSLQCGKMLHSNDRFTQPLVTADKLNLRTN